MFILEIVDNDYTSGNVTKEQQQNYLNRSSKIKGNWKDNKYSPNN